MYINIKLDDKEAQMIDTAMEYSGIKTRSELIRFLLTQYVTQWYEVKK